MILLPADPIGGGLSGIAQANGSFVALNRTPGKPLNSAFVSGFGAARIHF
jgi:hypothetical protein